MGKVTQTLPLRGRELPQRKIGPAKRKGKQGLNAYYGPGEKLPQQVVLDVIAGELGIVSDDLVA